MFSYYLEATKTQLLYFLSLFWSWFCSIDILWSSLAHFSTIEHIHCKFLLQILLSPAIKLPFSSIFYSFYFSAEIYLSIILRTFTFTSKNMVKIAFKFMCNDSSNWSLGASCSWHLFQKKPKPTFVLFCFVLIYFVACGNHEL